MRMRMASLPVLFFFFIFCCIFLDLANSSHVVLPEAQYADLLANSYSNYSSNYSSESQPYRTAYHFQPSANWMNDPNGPMFYKGYYHLFYQYNPEAAVWGLIHWGHAVSKDLIHWFFLEEALKPDQWYDQRGVWSGSITFLSPGYNKPAILYTGAANSTGPGLPEQMQCLAFPADYSDPFLRKWVKPSQNPVVRESLPVNITMFRDPTTAWMGHDGKWRMLVGSKRQQGNRGLALLYKSSDFVHWKRATHPLHTLKGTGMWECPDFFPVDASGGKTGLDTSANGPNVKHVLKVSLDENKHDYYAVGTYQSQMDSFIPEVPFLDAGIGYRYDYGKFYASKTFYDQNKKRRILIGWVNESSSQEVDIAKGWSSIQAIPREVWLDSDSGHSLIQWPIKEVESLRLGNKNTNSLTNVYLESGAMQEVKMSGFGASQIDVEAVFAIDGYNEEQLKTVDAKSDDPQILCSNSNNEDLGGSFGLYVLASQNLEERTSLHFSIFSSKGSNSTWTVLLCSDQSRSSLHTNVDKTSYGSFISIHKSVKELSLRVLVDRSVVEMYGQGGKSCITARVYPTLAIDNHAHLFVFNNFTHSNTNTNTNAPLLLKTLTAWHMSNATFRNLF